MGIIDVIIIVLFAFFMVIGFLKGFLKQIFTTFGWIVALIAATLLSKPAGNIIHSTSIGLNLNSMVFEWIASKGEIFTITISDLASSDLSSALTSLGIPTFLQQILFNMIDLSAYENMCLANVIAPKIVVALLTLSCFILIFLVVFIFAKILAKLSSKIVKGSALGFFDGLLGAAWSGVKVTIFVSNFEIVTLKFTL